MGLWKNIKEGAHDVTYGIKTDWLKPSKGKPKKKRPIFKEHYKYTHDTEDKPIHRGVKKGRLKTKKLRHARDLFGDIW